jgi:streptogrisin C
MSYRPAVRALRAGALVLALSATAVAFAHPAAATDTSLSPSIMAAMQHDLGLTPAQATQRLAAESAAAGAEQTLRAQLGDTFAGAWLAPAGGALVVGTTDPAKAGAIRAAGAQPVVTAKSEKDLQKVQAKLDRAAARATAGVGSWYVDSTINAVVVKTASAAEGTKFVADAGATADPVRVKQVAAVPRLLTNLVGGQAIYTSAGGRCSIGFSARSATATYVITAGHCTQLGGTWSGTTRVTIGPVAASNFPTDDFGAIRVNSTTAWTPTSQVADSGSVLGSTEAAVGASVCRSGSTTGLHCGTVTAKNATVNYGGGDIVSGLTDTTACAEPGDSGGSFVSGRQAQGMTSGGSGDCTSGGETFFQPIKEALSRYGLTLVTG